MSLINDALKRAKEAQHQPPHAEAPSLQFRPVEPSQTARHSVGLLVPFGLAGIALLLLVLVWERAQERRMNAEAGNSRQIEATRTVRVSPAIAPVTAPVSATPAVPAANGVGAIPVSATVASAQPKPSTSPEPGAGTAPVAATPTASSPSATNSAPAPETPAPKPTTLKLQSILFGSRKPSAMINGKPLFLGDRIGQFRVTSISEDSVTLVGAGQTNILSLNQ